MKHFKQPANRLTFSATSFSKRRTNPGRSHWRPTRKAGPNSLLCWKHSAHEPKYASNTFKLFLIIGRASSILSLPLERRSSHEIAKTVHVAFGSRPDSLRLQGPRES